MEANTVLHQLMAVRMENAMNGITKREGLRQIFNQSKAGIRVSYILMDT